MLKTRGKSTSKEEEARKRLQLLTYHVTIFGIVVIFNLITTSNHKLKEKVTNASNNHIHALARIYRNIRIDISGTTIRQICGWVLCGSLNPTYLHGHADPVATIIQKNTLEILSHL